MEQFRGIDEDANGTISATEYEEFFTGPDADDVE
jgi:hypothetical protein